MKVILKRISQDVDLLNPRSTNNFLVLVVEETNKEFRVPVSEETVQVLVREVAQAKQDLGEESEPLPSEDEAAAEATVFGDDEGSDEEEPPEEVMPNEPESEEQVKSL